MGTKLQILATVAFLLFWATHIFTTYSMVGFWTDGLLALVFCILAVRTIFNTKSTNSLIKWAVRVANVLVLTISLTVAYAFFSNPFFIDHFKITSFYYVYENGNLYNAYFKPVGAYSGGQGNLWIAEVPLLFPFIEHEVYYERAARHDFGEDMDFEMNPVNNLEVLRNYINRELQ